MCTSLDAGSDDKQGAKKTLIEYLEWIYKDSPAKLKELVNAKCFLGVTPLALLCDSPFYDDLSPSAGQIVKKLIVIGAPLMTWGLVILANFPVMICQALM